MVGIATSWGKRRQMWIATGLILLAIVFIVLIMVAVLYKAPSCMDHIQNQREQGIDCGGPCPYLCSALENAPTVRFVRVVSPQKDRYDVIAYVDNSNRNAGVSGAQYTVELYGTGNELIVQKSGLVTLPPGTTVPIFIPQLYVGTKGVTQAFLTFNDQSVRWQYTTSHLIVPGVTGTQIQNGPTPKVTATLTNPVAQTFYGGKVVATVFDAANNAVGASQTVISTFPSQGTVPVVFTWNQPFQQTPARVEILPVPGS